MDFFPNKKDFYLIEKEKSNSFRAEPIESIKSGTPVNNQTQINPESANRHRRPQKEEVLDHFAKIEKVAEYSNMVLEREKSPYRFKVYRENSEVFIDLIVRDRWGNIHETKKKRLTHEEFYKEIMDIEEREGLLIDFEA
jgi:hypothetical protein